MDRRKFIQLLGVASVGATVAPHLLMQPETAIPRYGRAEWKKEFLREFYRPQWDHTAIEWK